MSNRSGFSRWNASAASSATRIASNVSRWVISILSPLQTSPEYGPEAGVNCVALKRTPGIFRSAMSFSKVSDFIQGAPKTSNGVSVPRPTDMPPG